MVLRILLAIALLCGVAFAEEKPWAKGVSAENQKLALTLYNKANDLFEKGSYTEALSNYEAALSAWDHPGIHFNTAMCLKSLERWVEAYEHIQKALAYKEAPLGKDLYQQGQDFLAELKKRVGTLQVTLKTPGAQVRLDGAKLLDTPGTKTLNLETDKPHELVAEKLGYEKVNKPLQLTPGATTTLVLELKLEQKGKLARRWARWKPWAVVVTGGAVALAGAPLLYFAKQNFDDYDAQFAGSMVCQAGCLSTDVPAGIADLKTSGELKQTLAISAFALGGALIASGVALVVLNQPHLVKTKVSPTFSKEHVGAALTLTW